MHSICQKRRNMPFVHSPCLNCMWCLPSWLVSHCTVHIWITWVFLSHRGEATARCWLSVDTSNLFSISPCVEQSVRVIVLFLFQSCTDPPLCVILKLYSPLVDFTDEPVSFARPVSSQVPESSQDRDLIQRQQLNQNSGRKSSNVVLNPISNIHF